MFECYGKDSEDGKVGSTSSERKKTGESLKKWCTSDTKESNFFQLNCDWQWKVDMFREFDT